MKLSRRQATQSVAGAVAGWALLGRGSVWAADEAPLPPDPANRDHRRVMHFVDETGAMREVKTREDWARRRQDIVRGMEAAMGKLPTPRPVKPPASKVVSQAVEGGIKRSKILLELEPGEWVAAWQLEPADLYKTKRPAALALHQTHPAGKDDAVGLTGPSNRNYGTELARRGWVTLAPDYPSFGESKDYDFLKDRYISGTMKGIVNHMRCVDHLAGLSMVDGGKIAAIGHSLGGHNAMFLGAFDERVKAVVSSCGWTPFHDYYGGKLAGWTSQRYMPLIRTRYELSPDRVPFDFQEVVAALAPRGFCSVSPTGDSNFDVGGVRRAALEAGKVYKLLGVEGNLLLMTPEASHDFPPAQRRKSYEFMEKITAHDPGAAGRMKLEGE